MGSLKTSEIELCILPRESATQTGPPVRFRARARSMGKGFSTTDSSVPMGRPI